jgi:hypothetical protein
MAGHGPAPKLPEQRRDRSPKLRGEWVELSSTPGEVPSLPDGEWHPRAAASWALWWSDPAASQWSEAQRSELVELLALTDEFWGGNTTRANEMRLRTDGLGLTQKGKRDFRWRIVEAPEDESKPAAKQSKYQRLKAVPDAVEKP